MALARALPILAGLVAPALAGAHAWAPGGPGRLVGVTVEVQGRSCPLYPAPDGSERFYLEAREGARYAVRLDNRTGERVGVVLTVDGLNAISGQRETGPGRMYVLGPWEETTVRGWRTSLSEVRRFTFVDERVSYAARSGRANRKMGWIEVAVYRERRPYVRRPWWEEGWITRERGGEAEGRGRDEAAGPADGIAEEGTRPPAAQSAPEAALGTPGSGGRYAPEPRSPYPGTGWGPHAHDPAVLVDFEPEGAPSDRVTLRYEYASALRALGILPRPYWARDRLRERERAQDGFAPPPPW